MWGVKAFFCFSNMTGYGHGKNGLHHLWALALSEERTARMMAFQAELGLSRVFEKLPNKFEC
jgi:hypothetical protein